MMTLAVELTVVCAAAAVLCVVMTTALIVTFAAGDFSVQSCAFLELQ